MNYQNLFLKCILILTFLDGSLTSSNDATVKRHKRLNYNSLGKAIHNPELQARSYLSKSPTIMAIADTSSRDQTSQAGLRLSKVLVKEIKEVDKVYVAGNVENLPSPGEIIKEQSVSRPALKVVEYIFEKPTVPVPKTTLKPKMPTEKWLPVTKSNDQLTKSSTRSGLGWVPQSTSKSDLTLGSINDFLKTIFDSSGRSFKPAGSTSVLKPYHPHHKADNGDHHPQAKGKILPSTNKRKPDWNATKKTPPKASTNQIRPSQFTGYDANRIPPPTRPRSKHRKIGVPSSKPYPLSSSTTLSADEVDGMMNIGAEKIETIVEETNSSMVETKKVVEESDAPDDDHRVKKDKASDPKDDVTTSETANDFGSSTQRNHVLKAVNITNGATFNPKQNDNNQDITTTEYNFQTLVDSESNSEITHAGTADDIPDDSTAPD